MNNSEQTKMQLDKSVIMQEIKAQVQPQNGDREENIFQEISKRFDGENQFSYNAAEFSEHIIGMNANYNVMPSENDLESNGIKRILQKVVKKLVRFYIDTIADKQTSFNAEVTQTLNQVQLYHEDTQQDIYELQQLQRNDTYEMQKKIHELERELEQIKNELEIIKGKNDL